VREGPYCYRKLKLKQLVTQPITPPQQHMPNPTAGHSLILILELHQLLITPGKRHTDKPNITPLQKFFQTQKSHSVVLNGVRKFITILLSPISTFIFQQTVNTTLLFQRTVETKRVASGVPGFTQRSSFVPQFHAPSGYTHGDFRCTCVQPQNLLESSGLDRTARTESK